MTHPMGSREKLALFNMIGAELPGAAVLDAFAGSGALGVEALSRRAKSATFIEKNAKTTGVIRENLKNLGLEAKVKTTEAGKFETVVKFDIIFADPPYDKFKLEDVIYFTKYLKDGGILVLSHPGETPVIEGLKLTKARKYAGAALSIYAK